MVLKSKPFKKHVKIVFLSALALLLAGSSFFAPSKARADQEVNANDIQVQFDTFINGQPNNYVRVGKNGSFILSGVIRLAAPSSLTFNSTDIISGWWSVNPEIKDFVVGIKPAGNTDSYKCYQDSAGSVKYTTCTFAFMGEPKDRVETVSTNGFAASPGYILPINDKTALLHKDDFSISSAGFSRLGMASSSPQGVSYKIMAYPSMILDGNFSNYPLVFDKGAKEITVILYDTQAQAEIAERNEGRPKDVPGYGSTVTAPTTGGTGSLVLGIINQIIGFILGLIQELVYFLFYWLVAPIIQAMLSVRTYTDAFVGVIYPGWVVVRNVANITFIVALIAIGMATLFRIESYQFRHLLVQLIISALLVNFSLVIAQAILGIADTIQNQFLPNNIEVVRSLARDMMVAYRSQILNLDYSGRGYFAVTVQQLFWVALSLGSFMVFSAIGVFLVIRVVALWILLMLSPIAYVARILPSTHHFSSEWWSNFIKYAFFTPIMAFFLNMAAVMVNVQKENPVLKRILENPESIGGSNIASFVLSVASNIMLLIFLLVSLKVAEQFGVFGAHAVTEIAQKGIYAPFAGAGWLGKRGMGYIGRRWNEITTENLLEGHEGKKPPGVLKKAAFAVLNPKAFVKGWAARSQELQHEAREVAESGGREVAEQFLTRGKLRIPYRQFVERKHENDFLKDYENMRKETLMSAAVSAEKIGGVEGEVRRRAIVKAAAKNGYLDDLLRMKHFAGQYADKDGTFYSAEVLNRFLYGYLGKGEQSMRFMAEDMESLGKDTGHYEYLGHAFYDPDDKAFKRGMDVVGIEKTGRSGKGSEVEKLKNTWQVGFSIGELKKVGGRQRAGIAPHNLVTLRAEVDKDGNFTEKGDELKDTVSGGRLNGQLDEYQRAAVAIYDAATLRDAHFAQSRMKEWILSKEIDSNTGEVLISDKQDYDRIVALWHENPNFMKHMYAQLSGIKVEDVTGIRIAAYDPKTNEKKNRPAWAPEGLSLGKPEIMRYPVETEACLEIMKDKNLVGSLEKDDKANFESDLSDWVKGAFCNRTTKNDIVTKISAKYGTKVNAQAIADNLYHMISGQMEQRYNPIPAINRIDSDLKTHHKIQLTPADISTLNRELLHTAKEAFAQYAPQRQFNFTNVRVALENNTEIKETFRKKLEAVGIEDKLKQNTIIDDYLNRLTRHVIPVS